MRDRQELRYLYRSNYIVWVVKSGTLWWAGHVARMERQEMHSEF